MSAAKSSVGRGRPRSFDVDTVLDAALSVFWTQGYALTTTRDLERELGLTQSSIYHQFGSKQQLLELALDRYESRTYEAILKPLESSDLGIASIKVFYDDLVKWVTRDGRSGCMLINMMAEDSAQNRNITARTRLYRRRVRTALEAQLRVAASQGQIDSTVLGEKAVIMLSLVLGYNIAARGGASKSELNIMRDAFHLLLDQWRAC